mmetsp:Transcript_37698/g.87040  ORF Transcript_37698/g.87040 Transcript_37698/m.87040 type:complete len:237 (-) Transcript_37698:31-741(-)
MPPVIVLWRSDNSWHAPKSAIFASPLSSMRMFAPLTSRCTIMFVCRNSSPSKICRVYFLVSPNPYGPNLSSTALIEPPGMNSKKISKDGSGSPPSPRSWRMQPWYLTILGCLSRLSMLISNRRALISFSTALSFRPFRILIFFTAMKRPTTIALNTSPYAPLPNDSPCLYCLSLLSSSRSSSSRGDVRPEAGGGSTPTLASSAGLGAEVRKLCVSSSTTSRVSAADIPLPSPRLCI